VAQVQAAVEEALSRVIACGKAAGILTSDVGLAKRYIEIGAAFVAVGADVTLFAKPTSNPAAEFDESRRTRPEKASGRRNYDVY
jgi:4-hydroxy-2-oxoheptanedioate aldolase